MITPTRTLLCFSLVLGACVKPNSSPTREGVITQEQIEQSAAQTAYDVVARYRGDFIRNRGNTSVMLGTKDIPIVFLNDTEYGPLESLHDIRAADIAEIDLYNGPDAVIKFGSRYGGGVIQCRSRYR